MAATTEIRQYTGSGPTATAITNQKYSVVDAVNDTTNPVVRPSSGLSYSMVSTVALYCTVAPAGSISNLRYYSDGTTYGTGITVKGIQTASYSQAVSTAVDATVYTAGTDVTTYTSGSPLSITGSGSGTGKIGNYLRTQLSVASTAAGGTTSARTNSLIYDET